ncbi:MAG TPA: hypothetical protein VF251_09440 [Pyrinomonadaceae bacterium]
MLHRLFLVSVLSVCSAIVVHAQQPYRISDSEVERMIRRIEQQSDRFKSSLDSALDKSRLNGTNREDNINSFVQDYYEQTKTLRDHFDRKHSASADVTAVLEKAARIDDFMQRNRLSSRAQEEWSKLKINLDALSAAYNVSWRWSGYHSTEPRVSYPTGTLVGSTPYRLSDREVEKTLRQIEQQSDKFRSALDSSLDKSRFDGSREEDDINRFVKDFYERTKTLRDHFNDHKSTSADVQSVLERAADIDSFMRRNPMRRDDAAREWSKLRTNLDELAQAYNVGWQWRY